LVFRALNAALKRRSSTVVPAVAASINFRHRTGKQVPRFARNDKEWGWAVVGVAFHPTGWWPEFDRGKSIQKNIDPE
jgi:hypothetical protein